MKVKVYAKLNLTLNVLGKSGDYHDIDSVCVSVNVFDTVTVQKRNDSQVNVFGMPNIPAQNNTAYKAACAFMRQFGAFGADITIDKGIPVGAGMGGSSADAAATLYCYAKQYGADVDDERVLKAASETGSDVVFMMTGGLGRLRGKGDDVTFAKLGSPAYFALTQFGSNSSSQAVYAQFDRLNLRQYFADNDALMQALQRGESIDKVKKAFNNHLRPAVITLSGYAASYLDACRTFNIDVNMTGSGTAYYAAFASEQDASLTAVCLDNVGCATSVCKTVPCGIEEV